MQGLTLNINILIVPEIVHLRFKEDKHGPQHAQLHLEKLLQRYLKKIMLYLNLLKKLRSGSVMYMKEEVANQKILKKMFKMKCAKIKNTSTDSLERKNLAEHQVKMEG